MKTERRWFAIDKQKYIAELSKLLGFMSSWDRKAEIRRYERMFDSADDPEELIERLGTPTRVAVELARDYVSTPPPDMSRWENLPKPLPDEPEDSEEEQPEEGSGEPGEALSTPKPRTSTGGVIGFCIFVLILGIPIAVLLICIGIPFLAAGVSVIGVAVGTVFHYIALFNLFSDVLLIAGVALILAAIGLLLAWFGLWISISLCRFWIGKVLVPLGKKLCFGKEA